MTATPPLIVMVRLPTASVLDCTAIPSSPVTVSRAMIENVPSVNCAAAGDDATRSTQIDSPETFFKAPPPFSVRCSRKVSQSALELRVQLVRTRSIVGQQGGRCTAILLSERIKKVEHAHSLAPSRRGVRNCCIDDRLCVGIHGQLRVIDSFLGGTQTVCHVGEEPIHVHPAHTGEEHACQPAEPQEAKEKVLRSNLRLSETERVVICQLQNLLNLCVEAGRIHWLRVALGDDGVRVHS